MHFYGNPIILRHSKFNTKNKIISNSTNMWVIVGFADDIITAVPISWIIKCNGQTKCFWPLRDEQLKRSNNEIPPSFETDGWELHDCVLLLNGAIYDDFEEALVVEMHGIDMDDAKSANDRPKLSWSDEIETGNAETYNPPETSLINEELLYSEFQDNLKKPNLCSTINDNEVKIFTPENVRIVKRQLAEEEALQTNQVQNNQTEMLDAILKNQEEKKKMLVNLMARMYSLESLFGYHST